MPTQDDIDQQQQLLAAHRATLHHWLRQAAQHGGIDLAPPVTGNGIAEARAEIAQVKATLRGWGEVVEDLLDEQPPLVERASAHPVRRRSWWRPLGRRGEDIADPEIDRRNRQVFISDMRWRFVERLESAPKIIKLRLAERQGAVEPPGLLIRPYDLARRQPGQPDEPLPARMRLVDLYDEHNAQVLILGAPGAGKTFLLYELAHELVERAAADEAAPVPVIFSLAAWQPDQSLETWMIADLSRRYGAKQQVIARFVTSGAILPLLDGLDEVDTLERRQQCVEAINAYRQSRDLVPSLVIACREREYEDLSALKLNTALVVQPLAPTQVDRYLSGAAFEGLRQAMARDAALTDLARTPLLLDLMAKTYRDRAPQIPPGADEATLRQVVLGDYIAHCCAPRADPQALRVPVARLRAFLSWLARGMIAHGNQQDFYIEFLQPGWLPSRLWRWGWRGLSGLLSVLVFGLIIGLFIGAIIGLIFGLFAGLASGLILGLTFGLAVGLQIGLVVGLAEIKVIETLHWSWKQLGARLPLNMFVGLVSGLVTGLIGWLVSGVIGWLFVGVIGGLSITMLVGFSDGLVRGLVDERRIPNQAIGRSLRSAGIGGLVFGLIFGLVGGLTLGLIGGMIGEPVLGLDLGGVGGLIFGLVLGLLGGLVIGLLHFGGAAIIQHYALRVLLPVSTPAPLKLVPWLEEARMRGLLVRVGGGYRFYHELLQRHFATHEEPGFQRVPILAESEQLKKLEEHIASAD